MNENLKPCPQEAEALDIIESLLDVADMKCTGPLYADDPPRNGMCRIPEEDAAILRHYIAHRRAQPDNSRFADCHIWETGDKLETISDKCEVLITAADIKTLKVQPANEPLTLEQVKQATGEIWICYPQETWGPQKADAKDLHCSAYAFPFDTYGKTWLAYRRKPERSENNV